MAFLEHQTLSSSPDGSGHSYWASFSPKAHAKGSTKNAHRAVLNGAGPRGGRKALVKAFRNVPGTEKMCDLEITRSHAAMATAHAFNDSLGRSSVSVDFVIPAKAPMDEVAMRLLSRSSRKLTKSEWVLMEEELAKELEVYVTKTGQCSDTEDLNVRALETFVHFSFHLSAGRQVICGLKGVRSHKGFRLTTPVIHSADQKFGKTDGGEQGIREVFREHICTEQCRDLLQPDSAHLYPHLEHMHSEPTLLPPWSEPTLSPHGLLKDLQGPDSPSSQLGHPEGLLNPVASAPAVLQDMSDPRPFASDPQPIPPFGPSRQPSAPYDPEVFSEPGSGPGSPMFYTACLPSPPNQHGFGLDSRFTSSPMPFRRLQENYNCHSPFLARRFEGNLYSPLPGMRRADSHDECFLPGYYGYRESPYGSFPPSQLQCEAAIHRAMTCADQVTHDVKPRSFSAGANDVPMFPLLGPSMPTQ